MAENLSLPVSQKSLSPLPCQFSCRIVTIDYYTASPIKDLDVCYSEFRSSAVDKVPIIRIFGSTPSGQKTCLHVHGVFPYLYVPCVSGGAPTDSYMHQLARSIDHALQVSLGASSKSAYHVFKIVIVKGIPFYGYHDTEELFLKIYLYNPALVKRLSDLLVAGAVMNQVLQPHESHIPFVLQFMIDYNLYGMNYVHLSAVKFRLGGKERSMSPRSSQSRSSRLASPMSPVSPLLTHSSLVCTPNDTHWDVSRLPRNMIVCISKESVCELEVDVIAADIVNRHELSMVSGGYPGLAAIWAEERQRRAMLNIDLPLTPPLSPARCSQPYHPAEERLRLEFNKILEQRLGISTDAVDDSVPSVDNLVYSQSCDLDLNKPTSVEDYEDNDIAKQSPADQSVIVNEEIVQESMELSQRLSAETIKKSTDVELLELMMELCQTQSTDTTSQSLTAAAASVQQQHTQGEGLDNTLTKAHSVVSEKSLFDSPPASPQGDGETAAVEDVVDTSVSTLSDEDLFSGQDIEDEQTADGDSHVTENIERTTVMSHLSTHSPNTAAQNGHSSAPCTLVYGEEQSSCHHNRYEYDDEEILSGLHVSIHLPIAVHYGRKDEAVPVSSTSDKDRDGENRAQFEPDFDLSSRLTSPIPPSPESKEFQRLDFKELDSFNSSGVGRELDDMEITESQMDVPCAQPHHSPSPAIDPQAQADLHKVWNLTPPSLTKDSPLKLGPAPAANSQSTVQLEYDMPELSMTEFEVSNDPIINALESHTPSPLVEEDDKTDDLQTLPSSLPPSQLSRFCSTGSNSRRKLLQALSSATGDDSIILGGVEDDGVSVQSGESDEDNDLWMSQQVWDDEPCSMQSSASPPAPEVAGEFVSDKEATKERQFDVIPQLDGSGPSPQRTRKRRAKSLGVRKQRKMTTVTTAQRHVPPSLTSGDTNAAIKSHVTNSEGSEPLTNEVASGEDSLSKVSRRSLSLREQSKKLHRTKESQKSDEQFNSQGQLTVNPNKLEQASTLKKQALSCQFKLHLEKLSSSQFTPNINKKPPQTVSKKLPRAVRRRDKLRRSKRHRSDSENSPVDEVWKGKLKELSYVQQLRMALEESKKNMKKAAAGTPTEQLQALDKTLMKTTQDKNQTVSTADPSLSTSTNAHSDTLKQPSPETYDNQGPFSPQILSPVSTSSSKDLNTTVIAESPLNSETELEGAQVKMDVQVSQNTATDLTKLVSTNDDKNGLSNAEEVCYKTPVQFENVSSSNSSVVPKQPEDTIDDNVHSLDGLLDTSINSICESPPFTSSPIELDRQLLNTHQEEMLHNSDMKLHLDTSFDSVIDAPMETETAIMQASYLPADNNSSSETENEFHLALSSEDDNLNSSRKSPRICSGLENDQSLVTMTTKTNEKVTFVGAFGHLDNTTEGVLAIHEEPEGETKIVRPLISPPTSQDLMDSASSYGICSARHIKPFYSNPADVQLPVEVGGRILRVPSKMPYELKEFQPVYSKSGSDWNSQFSTTGLQQMRLIVSMLSSSIPGTQPTLPPLCHPPTETTRNNMTPYNADDHERDVELKSTFCSSRHTVVLTPAKPAPHPRKLAEQVLEMKQPKSKKTDKTSETMEAAVSTEELTVDTKQCDKPVHSQSMASFSPDELSKQLEENKSCDPTGKESGPKSPHSVRSNSSSYIIDDSLTSYQLQTHSTPVRDGDDCKETSSEMKMSDESSREQSCTPVRTKNNNTRPQFPFTPINSQSRKVTSQLEGPTPNNTYGFKTSQSALPGSCDIHEVQYLTTMSVEVHVRTRGTLKPDPEFDPVLTLFYYIHNDWPTEDGGENTRLGVLAIDIENCGFNNTGKATPHPVTAGDHPVTTADGDGYLAGSGVAECVEVKYVSSENELFDQLVQLVRETDPDFFVGYEVTMLSWGYLIGRAAALNINLANELSRMPKQKDGMTSSESVSRNETAKWWSSDTVHVLGRIVLNVWRLLKHEVALTSYSFESTAYHVLHQRIPLYSFQSLTTWYEQPTSLYRYRVIEHYLRRCRGNFDLLDKFNLIGRTSEFARLYGIEFENVTARGSQYRVESMMLRLAKPANYIAVSPSVQQRARMAAPECLPLILEPESKFYSDPVLVLDFQSLYPSMVIGYNYCFSTCLGRVRNLAQYGDFTFGTNTLNVPNHMLKKIKDHVHISPNGVVFVKHHIRKGVMTTMLEEILGTRIMVKGSMKQHKANKALERMLNARQLGLKLIANVTYGYTAASFSGRMPCVEIADSIVRKGRETLERAIQLVNSTAEWRARVVYGDTDSLFVLLKGVTKDEAFRIGKEIVEKVTADNPKPVKLKFEKVYLPCILQTKKRYVGYMYETLDQAEPVFEAKGIETVRRDGCPAVGKILEKSLHLLFTSKDLSLVKSYVQRQCSKLMDGNVNIQDYTFAKEYRGKNFYRPGACVPALELTKSSLAVDRRSEPRVGERVPYVIVYGTPGQPLIQLVRRPRELLENPSLRLNGVYYITKQILPALDRNFSLMGVDVRQWYYEMPRVFRAPVQVTNDSAKKSKGTLGQYFATLHCPICEQLTTDGVCASCSKKPQKVALGLNMRICDTEKTFADIEELCYDCVGSRDPSHHSKCISIDCPVLYRKHRAEQELATSESLRKLLDDFISTAVT